jgi:predicted nucleic acid-binding protein
MKYVVDTSVVAKWEIDEVDSDKARRLREDFRNGILELLAPDLLPSEVANAFLMAERRGRIPKGQYPKLLTNLLVDVPSLHETMPLLPRVAALTSAFQITVYDCLYVALAERENCELVTADTRLLNSLQKHFPFIVSLSSLP